MFHFKISKTGTASVAMIDPVNGNRPFDSLFDLIKFFKVYDPSEVGGLETLLTECVPLPPEFRY